MLLVSDTHDTGIYYVRVMVFNHLNFIHLRIFRNFFRPKSNRQESESDSDSDDIDGLPEYSQHAVKCGLFVSGLQNMALLALVDLDAANDVDTINSLVRSSVINLPGLTHKRTHNNCKIR